MSAPVTGTVRVTRADTAAAFDEARRLFRRYADTVEADPCFETLDAELETLHETHAPPGGAVWLAYRGDEPQAVGCVAVRARGPRRAELRRFFVEPSQRGAGVGGLLLDALFEYCREAGTRRLILDTMPDMVAARRMYARRGFQPVGEPAPNGVTRYQLDL